MEDGGLRSRFLFAIAMVLLLFIVAYVPIASQRPTEHIRFDTAMPEDIPGKDSDLDGLPDITEKEIGTNPFHPDTDEDRLKDGQEFSYWSTRRERGSEGEIGQGGVPQWLIDLLDDDESLLRIDPLGDVDDDGIINIIDRDSDDDGLPDGFETSIKTDPADPDTDKDGVPDGKDRNPTENKDENGNGIPDDLEYLEREYNHDLSADDLDLENPPDPAKFKDILFYVQPAIKPRYWRLRAFDTFDGSLWSRGDKNNKRYLGERLDTHMVSYVQGEAIPYTITFNENVMGFIPTALYTTKLWGFEPEVKVYKDPYDGFLTKEEKVHTYNFTAYLYDFTDEQLEGGQIATDPTMDHYLQVPTSISPRVTALALQLGQQGSSPFEKATLISDYLRENFKFNVHSETPSSAIVSDLVDWFLFESGEGRSSEFATAFVMMLRMNGIHARLAEGYAVGDVEEGRRVVKKGHSHTWGEIYLDGVGWLVLESTATRVTTEGSTGVSANSGDASVYSGGSPGTGGGTTSEETEGNLTDTTKSHALTLNVDKTSIWKGDLFTVSGEIKGGSIPVDMDMVVELSSGPDDTYLAGKGSVHDGKFMVVCTPDRANVGPNRILVSAEGQDGTIRYVASYPDQPPVIKIFSNTTIDATVPFVVPSGETLDFQVELLDDGGISYRNRTLHVTWADRTWDDIKTKDGPTNVFFLVTEPDGVQVLVIEFYGDDYLNSSLFTKMVLIRDSRLKLTVQIDRKLPKVDVDETINVTVLLMTQQGLQVNETISIYLDSTEVATGLANHAPFPIHFDRDKVRAGPHWITAVYSGSGQYPNATTSITLEVIGTTRILFGDKRVQVGRIIPFTSVLVDNLNDPLPDLEMEAMWTYPSGPTIELSNMTGGSGEMGLIFSTIGVEPGKMNITFSFKGSKYYHPSSTIAIITITSPTVLNANMPGRLVRGEAFTITGRLFNYRGDGVGGESLKVLLNDTKIGATITLDDGSFIYSAELLHTMPLGEAKLEVHFEGTELLDPQVNSSMMAVMGQPRLFISGPDVMDTGEVRYFLVELKDDRDQPLDNRTVIVTIKNGKEIRRHLITNEDGKVLTRVEASDEEVQMEASFVGETYLLPASSLKIVDVSYKSLFTVIGSILVTVLVAFLIINLLFARMRIKDARDSLFWSRRVKTKDRLRKIIFKIYRNTSIMFEGKGLTRQDSQTVREYEMDINEKMPVDKMALGDVTGVFEEARYSHHKIKKKHVKKAKKGYKRLNRNMGNEDK